MRLTNDFFRRPRTAALLAVAISSLGFFHASAQQLTTNSTFENDAANAFLRASLGPNPADFNVSGELSDANGLIDVSVDGTVGSPFDGGSAQSLLIFADYSRSGRQAVSDTAFSESQSDNPISYSIDFRINNLTGSTASTIFNSRILAGDLTAGGFRVQQLNASDIELQNLSGGTLQSLSLNEWYRLELDFPAASSDSTTYTATLTAFSTMTPVSFTLNRAPSLSFSYYDVQLNSSNHTDVNVDNVNAWVTGSTFAVPEPGSAGLAALGLLSLVVFRSSSQAAIFRTRSRTK
jgi:hypothetical protein